jgi:hypothetical protein
MMDLSGFWARIRLGRAFSDLERELDDELQDHFTRVVEDSLERGLDPRAAVEEGRRSLRRIRVARRGIRREDRVRTFRTWTGMMLPRVLDPVTEAIRCLRRRPGRHVIRVALYTVGLSSLGAMWAVTSPVRDLAPRSETELLRLDVEARFDWGGAGVATLDRDWVSTLIGHPDLKGAAVAWARRDMELDTDGERHPVRVRFTTSDYFQVLGARPASGRLLEPGDARRPVVPVVASHALLRRLGGDLVGARLELEGVPVEVVGSTERGFLGGAPEAFDLVVPLEATASAPDALRLPGDPAWDLVDLVFTVRVDRVHASRARGIMLERLEEEDEVEVVSVDLRPWYGTAFSASLYHSRGVVLFLVVASLTYFLTFLNGWTLEVAFRARHGFDSAVRRALGASRGQLLVREMLVGAVVGALAGAVSFFPAQWMAESMRAAVLDHAVGGHALGGGVALFWFVAGLGAATGGVAAFLSRVARPDEEGFAGGGAPGKTPNRDEPWLVAGVVGQAGMVMILGIAVTLIARAAWVGSHLDMGIEPDRLWAVQFLLPSGGAPPVESLRPAHRAVEGLDGVEEVVWSAAPPFGFLLMRTMEVSGPAASDTLSTRFDVVSPGFFDAMGTPLVSGSEPDPGAATSQVVVNQAFVDRYLEGAPDRDVCLRFPGTDGRDVECQTISGITPGHLDTRRTGSLPKVYFVQDDPRSGLASLILRISEGQTVQEQRALREAVSRAGGRGLDAHWTSLREASARDLEPVVRLLRMGLVGLLLALGVALAGLTGVVSLLTSRRARDFALRLALGARPMDLVREGLLRAFGWLATGTLIALLAFPLIRPLLDLQFIDGSGTEPLWKILPAVLILMMALGIGALGPIWRASRWSPSMILKEEG